MNQEIEKQSVAGTVAGIGWVSSGLGIVGLVVCGGAWASGSEEVLVYVCAAISAIVSGVLLLAVGEALTLLRQIANKR